MLLRNEDDLLPLAKTVPSIAVIGPLAGNKKDPLGCWALDGRPDDVVSLLEGVRRAVSPETVIHYAEGCGIDSEAEDGFAEAMLAASRADVVIVALGESLEMSGESHSRTGLDLPGKQRRLAEAIARLNKPIAAVLFGGRPLTLPWLPENAAAIVQAWHLGVQSGCGIADVLFGDYNPSGRLTATFPRNVGQIPIYYYRKKTGRPPAGVYSSYYIDSSTEPLYPFGYGLSYTRFQYGEIRAENRTTDPDGSFAVSIELTNVGGRAGEEVVQCYVRDEVASVTQPLKKLVAYRKQKVDPGETVTVSFRIPAADLAILDKDMKRRVEPGDFTLWIGPNSSEGKSLRLTVV